MRPRTARFDAAVLETTAPVVEVDVYDPEAGEVLQALEIIDGSVTLDSDAATRGAASVTVAYDPDLVPSAPTDLLAPYGNELHIRRGVRYADGTEELIAQGAYRIDEVNTRHSPGGRVLDISALDRSARIIEAVFEGGGTVAKGTNVAQQILDFVAAAYKDLTYDSAAFGTAIGAGVTSPLLGYQAGDDRWDFCLGLAEALGADLYFDGDGKLTIELQQENLEADLVVKEGDRGTLLEADKQWGREQAVNRVVVTGQSSGETPVTAAVADTNPLSPTYYEGKFGKVTFSYSSDYITTEAQAADVARKILRQKLGTGQRISFAALAHPALEPLDVAHVYRPELGVNELHIIDSVTHGLSAPRVECTTRVAQVQSSAPLAPPLTDAELEASYG